MAVIFKHKGEFGTTYAQLDITYDNDAMALYSSLYWKNGGEHVETSILEGTDGKVLLIFTHEGVAHVLANVTVHFLSENEAYKEGNEVIDDGNFATDPSAAMAAAFKLLAGGMTH